MKMANHTASLGRVKLLLLFSALAAAGALLNHFLVPGYIENLVLQNFVLSPSSASFASWQQSVRASDGRPLPIRSQFYFFNLTNAAEVLSGRARPKLVEVGPYSFRFGYQKVNISWGERNATVQYRLVKTWTYEPTEEEEEGERSLDDQIIHFNVPLISAVHAIENAPKREHYTAFESLNSLIDAYNMTAVLRHSVRELLFEGYNDTLLATASHFYPKQVKQDKFGWFFERNATSSDHLYSVFTGQSTCDGGLRKLGLLHAWNGSRELTRWPETEDGGSGGGRRCRSMEDTSAGDLHPPFFLQEGRRLLELFGAASPQGPPKPSMKMLLGDMCRSFELDYKQAVSFQDRLEAFRYRGGPRLFNYSIEQNRCYCSSGKGCPPTGLYDVGPCAKGSPIFVSFPHLLHAESSLQERLEGLTPDEGRHEFHLDYEKSLAIPLSVRIRLQVNLLVKRNEFIEIMNDWPESFQLYLPQFWSQTSIDLDSSMVSQLDFLLNKLPLVLLLATLLLAALSLLLLSYALFVAFFGQMFLGIRQSIAKYESVSILPNSDCKDGGPGGASSSSSSDYCMRPL